MPTSTTPAPHNFQPLGKGVGGRPEPRVTLPIPLGKTAAQTSKDLADARARLSFSPSDIEAVLRDGRIDNSTRKEVIDILSKDEVFGDFKQRMLHMNRDQQMQMGHAATRRILEIGEREDWTTHQIIEATLALDLQTAGSIHWVAFVPVIAGQGTPEQMERWFNRAAGHEILGCYCQTELGHGTDVQSLETTSTYDEKTDEFVLHSPTLTSTKWWAGGLGTTATHAIVQAQLIIKGKSYGPHLFFAPLRSLKDHKLFPGVVAGDIGPKAYGGFPTMDNGWARFDHYRIPRDNMLARFSKVKKGGEYVKPPSDRASYGGMVFIRSQMIDRTGWMLSRGATIAVRYCTVRRQFRDPSSTSKADQERAVISYPSLNRRLLPILAKSYCYIITGRRMRSLYEEMAEQLDKGDTTLLADVHVASSSLKAYCTKQALDGIEECRQALGGHGYSAYSGFSTIFPEQAPAVTYEGDNMVLAQQVGRALLKKSNELSTDPNASVTGTTQFVRAIFSADAISFTPPTSVSAWLEPSTFRAALGLRCASLVSNLRADIEGGRKFVELSHECVEVARCHAEVVCTEWFAEGVQEDSERYGSKATSWLNKVVALNALTSLSRNIVPLILPASAGRGLAAYPQGKPILTPESVLHLETAIRTLVEELLPQAVGLVDAFGWSDWELASSLGRHDGRVYEDLMAKAEANPINHIGKADVLDKVGHYHFGAKDIGKTVIGTYHTQVRPLLQAAGKRSGEGPIKGDGSKL